MLKITCFHDRNETRHYTSHPYSFGEFCAAIWLVQDGRLYTGMALDVCNENGDVLVSYEVMPGRPIVTRRA